MKLLRDQDGSALIEFALLLPVLVLLVVGMVDFGLFAQQMMRLSEAAEAGAAYGTLVGNLNDTTGMQTAATNSITALNGFTVTASSIWRCTETGANVTSSTTCTSSTTPIQYVQVTTAANVPVLLQFAGIPASLALHQSVLTRVGWHP